MSCYLQLLRKVMKFPGSCVIPLYLLRKEQI